MDKGRFVVENGVLTVDTYEVSEPGFSAENTEVFGVVPSQQETVTGSPVYHPHAEVLNAWAKAIARGGSQIADGREGLNGTMLSNAIQLSTFLGRAVSLPIDDELYYAELMKRVATSRRKEHVQSVVADTSATFGGNK